MSAFKGANSAQKIRYTPNHGMPLKRLDLEALKRELFESSDESDGDEDDGKSTQQVDSAIGSNLNPPSIRKSESTSTESRLLFSTQKSCVKDNSTSGRVSAFQKCYPHQPTRLRLNFHSNKEDSLPTNKGYCDYDDQLISEVDSALENNLNFSCYLNPESSFNKPESDSNRLRSFERITWSHNKENRPKELNSAILSSSKQRVVDEANQNVFQLSKRTVNDKTFRKIVVNKVQYLVLNLLGMGGTSKVYQCFNVDKKDVVAIKCISLKNMQEGQNLIDEIKLLQKLKNCLRVIKLFDYEQLPEELLLVLEKGGVNLSSVLKKTVAQKRNIPYYKLVFYWMEMLQAMKEIHDNGVIHSDIKPSNFLVDGQGLKLIDFGIAASVQSDDALCIVKQVPEGSPNYVCPEALRNISTEPGKFKYAIYYKSDVWSLGCILYELVYKIPPFYHLKTVQAKLSSIQDPNYKINYPEVDWLPPKIINTIKKCLQYNIQYRPSIAELIKEYEQF
ncbi:unnamed protein product [Phyllotreta striolata]|uniref:Protein kinase domain-containing protein n=1 Tax=Phyllotreta striolata TaxID=444603 RepID=A0A9N9XR13_PHYSR|nr:unnamed protein product [Phyllotreta striolata]